MIIKSKAPLRISFAGGGTDIEPYVSLKGGKVISATINRYAYTTLKKRNDKKIKIYSHDYNTEIEFNISDDIKYDGNLDLIKCVIKNLGIKGISSGMIAI